MIVIEQKYCVNRVQQGAGTIKINPIYIHQYTYSRLWRIEPINHLRLHLLLVLLQQLLVVEHEAQGA